MFACVLIGTLSLGACFGALAPQPDQANLAQQQAPGCPGEAARLAARVCGPNVVAALKNGGVDVPAFATLQVSELDRVNTVCAGHPDGELQRARACIAQLRQQGDVETQLANDRLEKERPLAKRLAASRPYQAMVKRRRAERADLEVAINQEDEARAAHLDLAAFVAKRNRLADALKATTTALWHMIEQSGIDPRDASALGLQ